jgi:hypothetical protein
MLIYAIEGQTPCSYETTSQPDGTLDHYLVIHGYDEISQRVQKMRIINIPGCVTSDQRHAWLQRNVAAINQAMLLGLAFSGIKVYRDEAPHVTEFDSLKSLMLYVAGCIASERGESLGTQQQRRSEILLILVPYLVSQKLEGKTPVELTSTDFDHLATFTAGARKAPATCKATLLRFNALFREASKLIRGWNIMLHMTLPTVAGHEPSPTTPIGSPFAPDHIETLRNSMASNPRFNGLYIATLLMEKMMLTSNDVAAINIHNIDLEQGQLALRDGRTLSIPADVAQVLRAYDVADAPGGNYLVGSGAKINVRVPLKDRQLSYLHGQALVFAGLSAYNYGLLSWNLACIQNELARGLNPDQICKKFQRSTPDYVRTLIEKHGLGK